MSRTRTTITEILCALLALDKDMGHRKWEKVIFDLVKCFEGNVNVMNKFFICVGEFEFIGIGVN